LDITTNRLLAGDSASSSLAESQAETDEPLD
jgi:hypothetical protein